MNNKGGDNLSISKAIELCGNHINSLRYLQDALKESITQLCTQESNQAAMAAVEESLATALFVEDKVTSLLSKLHDGSITEAEINMLKPGYFNYQDSLVEKQLQSLDPSSRDKLNNVMMVYDINHRSEFVRGYMSHDLPLDPTAENDKKIIDVMDQSFHSWLVSHQLASQQGVIYKTDKVDNQGFYVNKADPQMVSSLLRDPLHGLEATIKKQDPSITMQVRDYKTKATAETSIPAEQAANITRSDISATKSETSLPDIEGPTSSAAAGG